MFATNKIKTIVKMAISRGRERERGRGRQGEIERETGRASVPGQQHVALLLALGVLAAGTTN